MSKYEFLKLSYCNESKISTIMRSSSYVSEAQKLCDDIPDIILVQNQPMKSKQSEIYVDDESCKSSILTPRQPLADIDLAQIQKNLQRNCPFEFSEAIQKDSSAAKEKLGEQLILVSMATVSSWINCSLSLVSMRSEACPIVVTLLSTYDSLYN